MVKRQSLPHGQMTTHTRHVLNTPSSANGQKLTALAPAMDLIAIGTTDNRVSILRYPSLEAVVPVIELKSELVDLNWGGKEGKWVSSIYQNPGMS
jgi:hypothetical protein